MANFFKPSAKSSSKLSAKQGLVNHIIEFKITRLDQNGCGVGSYQNSSVFVENTLPNEVVKVKVVEQKSKYIKAQLLEHISLNPDRVTPFCRYFSKCGGCDLQHMSETQQLEFKKNKVLGLLARVGIDQELPWQPTLQSESAAYRRKARIGVQFNKNNEATVGFRKKASNELINIRHCPILTTELSDIFAQLKKTIDQLSSLNSVGHVEVISASKPVVVVRQLTALLNNDKQVWLKAAAQHNWQLCFDNGNNHFTVINEEENSVIPAPLALLQYQLLDNTVIKYQADDFIQVNHHVNQLMVAQALQWLALTATDRVLDLFCGLGNFTLPIAKHVADVVGIEGVPTMVTKAEKNAFINNVKNCRFFQADLNMPWQSQQVSESWQSQRYNKILLDPARAGAEVAVQQLQQYHAEKILYVSCDPASLARDSALLLAQGYQIEKIALMDMFSHTKHIETMVLFTSRK